MLGQLKYGILILSSIIVLLHGMVPHVHAADISEQQHEALHATEATDNLSMISLCFHEYSEADDFEEILVFSDETAIFSVDEESFYCVPELGYQCGILYLQRADFAPPDAYRDFFQSGKNRFYTAVRPPPFR